VADHHGPFDAFPQDQERVARSRVEGGRAIGFDDRPHSIWSGTMHSRSLLREAIDNWLEIEAAEVVAV
jgi:hypothetical protein